MFSVYRKELKLYFRIKSTYILLTVLLATVGILTAIFAPVGGLQFIPVYLAPVTFAVLPLSQIFADRRQKRTHFEDCYFAMGISPLSLTIGRFLAALTVFLIPVLELALLPLLFCAMGSVALGSVYTSILGYILLIALLLAMEQALLCALLTPHEELKALQEAGNFTELMVRQEQLKTLPWGIVWEEYLERQGLNVNYLETIRTYEEKILKERV